MHPGRDKIIAGSIFTAGVLLLFVWLLLICQVEKEPEGLPVQKEDTQTDENDTEPEPCEQGVFQDEQGKAFLFFGIPNDFCLVFQDGTERQSYQSQDTDIYVSLSLRKEEADARECILQRMEFIDISQMSLQQTEVNGRVVYYFSEWHERIGDKEREQFYSFYAAIDLKEGLVYWLQGDSMKNETALECETYMDFLRLEEAEQ